ncbi:MAG: ester cyclase [Pseudomonadota bacterium]
MARDGAFKDWRTDVRDGLDALLRAPETDLHHVAQDILAENAVFYLADPLPQLVGRDAILDQWIKPLRAAFGPAHRRDILFLGGRNIRDAGGTWITALTHYVGTFDAPFCGLKPSNRLAFLRSGEFYRMENGQITEAKIIFDLPDLMRQGGRFPLPRELGTEMMFPAPATQDGLWPGDGVHDAATMAVVEGMLADLHVFDPQTMKSDGQTGDDGYWHEDMLWYGPGGIGSNYRWSGFVNDHRRSFLTAFPDRKGGNHYCRISDGNYAAVSGWPSMTMTHRGPYLGVPATDKALTLRVMDFYRCAGGKIMENWVCLDYMDLTRQMGRDLVAEANALAP